MTDLLGPSGMPEIREDILTDILNEAAKTNLEVPIEPGSDAYAKATGVAGGLMFAHARIDSGKDACTPNTAPAGPDLDRFQRALRLPDVPKSQAVGRITVTVVGDDPALIPDGQPGTIDGQRFEVVNGPWSGLASGDDVDIRMVTPGSKGNKAAGKKASFLNPPTNVSPECKVSKYKPISGGFDDETPERKRTRILNRTGTTPGGGNWGHLREIAFNASPGVQQCFVYPTIGGPSTTKVVSLKSFDRELFDFSRQFPDGAQPIVRNAIHRQVSTGNTYISDTSTDEPVDVSLKIEIPDSTLVGGAGQGWTDGAPWPPLEGGDTRVTVTSVNAAGLVTVNASTSTEPVPNQTRVAWWSPFVMRFYVRTVVAFTGSSGAWVLTLEAPFVDETGETPASGHYISPAAENLEQYAKTWVDLMEALGAGENTSDSELIAQGRALRHPSPSEGFVYKLTSSVLLAVKGQHSEMTEIEYSYRSKTQPTVPASVDDPPNVLTPQHFGVYPL